MRIDKRNKEFEFVQVPAILRALDCLKISTNDISKALGIHVNRVSEWRMRKREIPAHLQICFAYLLKYVYRNYKLQIDNDLTVPAAERKIFDSIFHFCETAIRNTIERIQLETDPADLRRIADLADHHLFHKSKIFGVAAAAGGSDGTLCGPRVSADDDGAGFVVPFEPTKKSTGATIQRRGNFFQVDKNGSIDFCGLN